MLMAPAFAATSATVNVNGTVIPYFKVTATAVSLGTLITPDAPGVGTSTVIAWANVNTSLTATGSGAIFAGAPWSTTLAWDGASPAASPVSENLNTGIAAEAHTLHVSATPDYTVGGNTTLSGNTITIVIASR
jgi:hypothetical protein